MVLALGSFMLAHVIPPLPPVRARLLAALGRRGYLLAYSLLSTALLVWVLVAAARAPHIALWTPRGWHYLVPVLVMPMAFWLAIAGLFQRNPLSLTLRASPPHAAPGAIVRVTRHPVLWGLLLWALAHIPPNGDLVSLLLFGFMAALAAAGFVMLDRRRRRRLGRERWRLLASGTTAGSRWSLLPPAVAALGLFAWFLLQGHALLIGVDPLAGVMP
ncbi:NnrU family protein [Marinimicrococcus flavescens]|uniref:NnrU family protein n=1 Tax=Marinimicrococcus flavescens TaxID=3031815 RepID=A0AAP4D5R8_9PROT|nr:NnrU family protein [Marinimicrococcus flavescens]